MVMFMKNKKGFTLIEVVVALGILAMALAGAVTLITVALRLSVESRNVTQATALMQKGIADGSVAVESCCTTAPTLTPPGKTSDYAVATGGFQYTPTVGNTKYTLFVSFDQNFADQTSGTEKISKDKFTKVTSKVTWDTNTTGVSTTQYLRNGS